MSKNLTAVNPLPEMENPLNFDYVMMKKSSLIFRALNHKLRQQILQLIANKGKINVTDIYTELRIEQSVASQHLAILRKINIINTTRVGKMIYYNINHERVNMVKMFVKNLLG